ncbi:hypothetical protein BK661_02210 [Pseudomonas frederiksbergensis]|uniref:Uncharacterized protein n=1 Tax=Pseudomonas frederiksbergensis TaxID=104087 RepID=A0A423JG32_9PSED|nr:hypothetical protein BK661_02210 [Pseudomonas frederiksbergensis]
MGREYLSILVHRVLHPQRIDNLWRGGLLPLGCEAALKSADAECQIERGRFGGCFAAQREQAPSPQKRQASQDLDLDGNIQINPLDFARS